jgi:tetratricopeptide (TPR) repeat protein
MRNYTLVFILFCTIKPLILKSQIDTLEYREVHFYEIDSIYQPFFLPFKDSAFLTLPTTYFNIGYSLMWRGKNQFGNDMMEFALDHFTEYNGDLFHEMSVHNTKNGNYGLAVQHLNKAVQLDPKIYGYYGWVTLYYYRDYERALEYLNRYDSLTPNFTDFPVGENIHYLRGLAYMQLKEYDLAIQYFDLYIEEEKSRAGIEWIDHSAFYYKGICLEEKRDFKSAKVNYELAIKYLPNFVEALYHRALLIEDKELKVKEMKHILTLIDSGFSKVDPYMEIFHPVYRQDVEKSLLF